MFWHIGLQAAAYQNFLLHDLPKLLEYVPLAVRKWIWYMHDGAPHFSHAVQDVLNNMHHEWWIGREGPTAWPPRSPEINPLVFHVGTPKISCVLCSCFQWRGPSPLQCGCLSDCPHLPRHLWMGVAVYDETCEGMDWISWRTFWELIINVLFQV
jgi:hypothetical protein